MMYFLIFINVFSFVMMTIDKYKAIHRQRRLPETAFILLSLCGGFIGIFVGIFLINHKNRKTSFQFKVLLGTLGFALIAFNI